MSATIGKLSRSDRGGRQLGNPRVSESRLGEVLQAMGGADVIGPIDSALKVHDLVRSGLPNSAVRHFLDSLVVVGTKEVANALGISPRTVQRLKKRGATERLSADQSDRAWQFAEVLARAREVFGSQEAGERWLEEPAIGLDQRRPIDLLGSTAGTEAVKAYLDRIDFGVYA